MNLQDAMVPEALGESIEALLPPGKPEHSRGRPRVPDRQCLAGVVYLLKTGCQWKYLPCKELGCGSPATVWRRLRDWSASDVWPRLHRKVLSWCGALGEVDPKHVLADSASFRAFLGGLTPGPAARIVRKKAANAM